MAGFGSMVSASFEVGHQLVAGVLPMRVLQGRHRTVSGEVVPPLPTAVVCAAVRSRLGCGGRFHPGQVCPWVATHAATVSARRLRSARLLVASWVGLNRFRVFGICAGGRAFGARGKGFRPFRCEGVCVMREPMVTRARPLRVTVKGGRVALRAGLFGWRKVATVRRDAR